MTHSPGHTAAKATPVHHPGLAISEESDPTSIPVTVGRAPTGLPDGQAIVRPGRWHPGAGSERDTEVPG
jgi:hypothetical protein